jgi:dTDP-4-dehydrorhamnose reductase
MKTFLAGHNGLVGSSIHRKLHNAIVRTHKELDLCDSNAVDIFFKENSFDYVILAAARVGGILANKTYPAQWSISSYTDFDGIWIVE